VHYNNASGVRASCGDCHVSEGVFAATWDHAVGGKDLLKQIKGRGEHLNETDFTSFVGECK
jgi:nitrate/TMAO reductase-like tetraheme cytochrome c subunit